MKLSLSKIKQIKALCAEIGEEDGIHPNDLVKKNYQKKNCYKALQLSKQVERTLHLEWPDAFAETILADLKFVSVEPDISGSKLLLTFILEPEMNLSESEIMAELKNHRSYLRAIIAQAIHRKKVPELTFRIIPKEDILCL